MVFDSISAKSHIFFSLISAKSPILWILNLQSITKIGTQPSFKGR